MKTTHAHDIYHFLISRDNLMGKLARMEWNIARCSDIGDMNSYELIMAPPVDLLSGPV